MSSSQPATCSCLFSLTSQGDDPFLLIEMSMDRRELHEKRTTQSLLLLPFFPPLISCISFSLGAAIYLL